MKVIPLCYGNCEIRSTSLSAPVKLDPFCNTLPSVVTIFPHIFIQVLSMNSPPFGRTVTERDWLKNSAKIWELVKSSPIIAEYSRTLQSCGMFRR